MYLKQNNIQKFHILNSKFLYVVKIKILIKKAKYK